MSWWSPLTNTLHARRLGDSLEDEIQDLVVMASASTVLLLTTSIAVVLPAYRAATMDPLVALREEL
jgi:ABC-type lipoprotein release transport system permease subunit